MCELERNTNIMAHKSNNQTTTISGIDLFTVKNKYNKVARPLHIKGWTNQVNHKETCNAALRQQLIEFAKSIKPTQVVFDGKSYKKDSFTELIPHLLQELGDSVELVAFVRECDVKDFCESWRHTNTKITIYVCPTKMNKNDLGKYALQKTGSLEVFCYGGGDIVTSEYIESKNRYVKFTVFAITRPSADGEIESAPLVKRIRENDKYLKIVTYELGIHPSPNNVNCRRQDFGDLLKRLQLHTLEEYTHSLKSRIQEIEDLCKPYKVAAQLLSEAMEYHLGVTLEHVLGTTLEHIGNPLRRTDSSFLGWSVVIHEVN